MQRPSQIKHPANVHALVDEIAPDSALRLALEILSRESGCWALFLRMGDNDLLRPDEKHAFAILKHADGDGADRKLHETIAGWLAEHGPNGLVRRDA